MKSVVKFLSVVILFLSTSLSAQRTYKMLIQNSKLVIESVDVTPKTGFVIETDSTPMFDFYDVNSKVVLGVEPISNFTDTTLAKYMNMDNGDTRIGRKLKYNVDGECVEFFYYSKNYITNYFTPQLLEKTDYVLKVKDETKTLTYTIKNGKIEKETL
jgi:hypothetical protein